MNWFCFTEIFFFKTNIDIKNITEKVTGQISWVSKKYEYKIPELNVRTYKKKAVEIILINNYLFFLKFSKHKNFY